VQIIYYGLSELVKQVSIKGLFFSPSIRLPEVLLTSDNIEKIKKEEDEMNKILLIDNIQNKVVTRKRI